MKKKIVVMGYMLRCPIAGVVWQNLNYIVGLQRLGFDVHYLEDADRLLYDVEAVTATDNFGYIVPFARKLGDAYGFKWAFRSSYQYAPGTFGCEPHAFTETLQEADAVFNICGVQDIPEFGNMKCLVYVESDPGLEQILLAKGNQKRLKYLKAHHMHFTFGEKIGTPACSLPITHGIHWRPTRQPVVLDFWENSLLPPKVKDFRFTTITGWRPMGKDIEWENETYYWSKHFEFLKFSGIPSLLRSQVPLKWELAVALNRDPENRAIMEKQGWILKRPQVLSVSAEEYRNYIFKSDAEWTVAKDQYVRLNAGWFSDRSACYLAAARPVITQETGFSDIIPQGEGLFSFRTIADIQTAVDRILSNPRKHSEAALAIAHEYFDAEKICKKMVQEIGL